MGVILSRGNIDTETLPLGPTLTVPQQDVSVVSTADLVDERVAERSASDAAP